MASMTRAEPFQRPQAFELVQQWSRIERGIGPIRRVWRLRHRTESLWRHIVLSILAIMRLAALYPTRHMMANGIIRSIASRILSIL